MNSLITGLNSWGERFVNFAWPMLWQSSLLIVALFALDLALRRKARPAVRYALWLVLLVKLLLPPTFAAPTSLAWWIRPSPSPEPQVKTFAVSIVNGGQLPATVNRYEAFTQGKLESPGAHPTWPGLLLLGSGLASLGLMTWMLLRWGHVARMVCRAAPATEALAYLVNDARQTLRQRRSVRLRFTDEPMSPAVCGLFRPVIILPQSLAENFPTNQLRAVLLHELVHLKRSDVWVNCVQALLQVVYWWHPLLWLANARIRRLREEAVDDAVMLALRDDAASYAPTLLEVAKLAFHRPTTVLGLVGIMESRSALRQRIERLVNSDTPRKSGLTILSAVGVLAFSALAVPMEKAPSKPAIQLFAQATTSLPEAIPSTQPSATLPVAPTGRQATFNALHTIRLGRVFYDNMPLPEVVRSLSDEIRKVAPDLQGLNLILNPNLDQPGVVAIDPTTGLPVAGNYVPGPEPQWPQIKINPALTNIALSEVLDIIVKVADRPLRYSIEDFGVMFFSGKAAEPLFMREFKWDRQSFENWVRYAAGIPPSKVGDKTYFEGEEAQSIHRSMRGLFLINGVDLNPPKSVFYSHGAGALLVNATQSDLDTIQRLVEMWNTTSPPAVRAAATPSVDNSNVRPPSAPAEKEPARSVDHPANRFKSNSQSILATNQFSFSPAATETNATALVRSAKLLLEIGKLDEAEEELKAALRLDPENQPAFYYWSFVKETRYRQADRLREQRSKHAIQVEQNWSSSDFKNHLPVPNPFATNTLIWTGSGRQSILNKLNSIKLGSVFYDGLRLSEVVRNLNDETKKRDPLKKGLNFIINPNAQAAASPPGPTAIHPSTGLPVTAPPAEAVDVGSIPVKINPALIDMRLADVLDIIVKVADRPIKYSVEEWGIMFSLKGAEAQPLFMREFKWDRQSFEKWVRYAAGIPPSKEGDKTNLEGEEAQAMHGAVRGLFLINGVDLNAPKSVFYSHGAQALLVNATQADLDKVERLVEMWNTTSPPIASAAVPPPSGSPANPALESLDSKVPGVVPTTIQPRIGPPFQLNQRTPPGLADALPNSLYENTRGPRYSNTHKFGLTNAAPQILIEAKFVELADFDPDAEPGDSPLRILSKDDAGNTPARVKPSRAETELRSKFPEKNNLILETVSPPTVTRTLTEEQTAAVLARIHNRSGSDVLCPPKIISKSGQQAQIQVSEMTTVVAGVKTNAIVDANGKAHPGINYLTENIPFGPTLDVVPRLVEDGSREIHLTVSAHVTEFVGYDDPGEFRISVGEPGAKPVKGVLPLPRVRLRELEASASLENGQTILFGGPVSYEARKVKDKVPVLGDVPWLGRLFRSTQISMVKKHLVILLKASLVDEKGDPADGTSAAAPPNP